MESMGFGVSDSRGQPLRIERRSERRRLGAWPDFLEEARPQDATSWSRERRAGRPNSKVRNKQKNRKKKEGGRKQIGIGRVVA